MLPVSGLAGSSFWASTESSATAPAITLAGARGGKWMSGRVFRTAPNDAIRQGSRRGLTSRNSPAGERRVRPRTVDVRAAAEPVNRSLRRVLRTRSGQNPPRREKNLPNKRANPACGHPKMPAAIFSLTNTYHRCSPPSILKLRIGRNRHERGRVTVSRCRHPFIVIQKERL